MDTWLEAAIKNTLQKARSPGNLFQKASDVPMLFRDMETGEEITLQPAQLRDNYQEAVRVFTESFRRRCLANRIDFVEIDTQEPYDTALLAYMNKRRRLG